MDTVTIYWCGDFDIEEVSPMLREQATDYHDAHILDCPGVRAGLKNVYAVIAKKTSEYVFDKETLSVEHSDGRKDDKLTYRVPYFENSFFFSTGDEFMFFAEEPMLMKATAPWFKTPKYLGTGTTISGQYDIGKWARPLQIDVICWQEKGTIKFESGDPLYYVQFETDKKIIFKKFRYTPVINGFITNLVFDPRRTQNKRFGTLEKRYDVFHKSDYYYGLLDEIKINLLEN